MCLPCYNLAMKKILFLLLIPFYLNAAEQPAIITKVVDGDTVYLSFSGTEEKIRIVGIDTPEIVASNRPVGCFGQEASDQARKLLPLGSSVVLVHSNERDKYDRLLGYITLSDDTDFGLQMIQDGYAYAYRSFDHERKSKYIAAESRARLNKIGLWADDACRYSEQSIDQATEAWKSYYILANQIKKIIESIIALF